MAHRARARTVWRVVTPVIDAPEALVDEYGPLVHGVAVAASSDPDGVTVAVLGAALGAAQDGARVERRAVLEHAVLHAVEHAPAPTFAAMAVEDRAAVALVRLAGYSVADVATALAVGETCVKARMLRGLRALRTGDALRTPPPRPDS